MQVRQSEGNPQVWYVGEEIVQLLANRYGRPQWTCTCPNQYISADESSIYWPVSCPHIKAVHHWQREQQLAELTRLGQELQTED